MCGIIAYKGEGAKENVLQGLKSLEYRGYDSWGITTLNNNKIKQIDVLNGHTGWAIEKFIKCKNYHNLKHSANYSETIRMNILNFIKKENYYALVDKSFQDLIKKRLTDRKKLINEVGISYRTLSRMLNYESHWCNLNKLFSLSTCLNIKKDKLIKSIKKIKTKNSFPIDFKNIKLTNSLARILGHTLGDGGIHVIKKENKYRSFYVNNEGVLLDSFNSDIKDVFGKSLIYFRKRKNHGDEIWISTTIGFILYNLLDYENFKDKRIPNWIKEVKDFERDSKGGCISKRDSQEIKTE